jgi:alpha-tubulin suppressor-like RCC1 family protein
MPSGFKTFAEEEFDRVFIKDSEIIDNFVGNRLWTDGQNGAGQQGSGNTTNRTSPGTTVGGGVNWKQVSGSDNAGTAGIKTDGTLWTWGFNNTGQLGDGTITNRSSPGTTAGGGTDWKQVSCGYRSTIAIKNDGSLWTWGHNSTGQLGTGNTTSRSSPGTTAGGGTNWKQVSIGALANAFGIKTDGTLWSWGRDSYGQLAAGTSGASRSSPVTVVNGGTNWKQVAAGQGSVHAIKTDGTLWGCGYNSFGQIGDNTTTNRSSFVSVSGGGTNWKQVHSGFRLAMAVKTDGTLWTWGNNNNGQLGDGTKTGRSSPGTTAGGGTDWKSVPFYSGDNYTIGAGIKTDGTLWTWGGPYGLGTGQSEIDANRRSSPGTTLGNSTYRFVSVFKYGFAAIGD